LANAKSKRPGRTAAILAMAVTAVFAVLWLSPFGQRLRGDAIAGTAYGARVGCSCRFVSGRSMSDCSNDKLAGMALIRFTADAAKRSVTASVPFVASDTASFRDGYGCVLQSWITLSPQ